MRHLKTYKKLFESSEADISKYQAEYNALLDKIKQAEEEANNYISQLKPKGYYVTDKGEVVNLKDEWGVFWDTTFYSHYDGHAGDWVYSYSEGAKVLKEEQSDAIRELITCWDILTFDQMKDKLMEALNFYGTDLAERISEDIDEYGEDGFDKKSNTFSGRRVEYEFRVSETSFEIVVVNDEHEEYTPMNGSHILFKLTSNEEIKSVKKKNKRGY